MSLGICYLVTLLHVLLTVPQPSCTEKSHLRPCDVTSVGWALRRYTITAGTMKRSRTEVNDAAAQHHKRVCHSDTAPTHHHNRGLFSALRAWSIGTQSFSKSSFQEAFRTPEDDASVRTYAMNQQGIEVLEKLASDEKLLEAVLVRYQLQEELSTTAALVGGTVLSTLALTLPSAARAALLFGCAANSIFQLSDAVAWHHYVLLECPSCTISLELLRRGVCVRMIQQSEPRGRQLMHQHRQELKSCGSGRHAKVAEELACRELDCNVGLQPVIKWLKFNVLQQYDLVSWNCQHFSQDLMGVLSSFVKNGST